MRILFLLLLTLGIQSTSLAQIYDPVKWTSSLENLGGDQYLLIHKAEIEAGWSVYSQYLESDEGPVATLVSYDEDSHFELIGENEELGNKKEGFDDIFEMNVTKYYDHVMLRQKIKLVEEKAISGYVNFMCCDATKCLPPTDYEFVLHPSEKKTIKSDDGSASLSKPEHVAPSQSEVASVTSEPAVKEENVVSDQVDKAMSEPIASKEDVIDPFEEVSNQGSGNLLDPVKWSYAVDLNSKKAIISGVIDDGWHIYSNTINPDDGPIPTEIYLNEELIEIEESAEEVITGFDDIFEVEITKLKKKVELTFDFPDTQEPIQGEVVYMACDKSKCIMPEPAQFTLDPVKGTIGLSAMLQVDDANKALASALYTLDPVRVEEPIGACEDVKTEVVAERGLWGIFSLGFFGGLLALLTPCVFPMIPLTVSFFTKGSENKSKGLSKAVLYGFFILLIYLLLSVPFHLMDSINPGILNDISTNVVLNLVFFAVFLFFAFSFFGFYEITMPSSWSNRASSAEGIGGTIGIFFMALTLALVSFSCTGPILGTLLAGALTSDGGATQLTAGMGGFGLALALPFAVFAAFPGLMGSIPKSGGWLNTVKVVLGFLELGLAFKFLSNADLVKRWGLLKIEPFLIIEILIFAGLALYLFGKIKFPHDSPLKKLSFGRITLGVLSAAFAIYLASGFRVNQETNTFQSLTLLSGLAPPVGYSWMFPNKCPNDLDCFKDLESGMTYAQKVNKPVMIDFTGHACVNCRRMEEHVWPKEEVIDHLKNNYVLISLYVDERIELPEEEQLIVESKTGRTQKLRTVGNKWTHFQTEYFNNNSQPYYVLLSPEGDLLNAPVGYMPDAEEYAAFLDCGLGNFEASSGKGSLGSN